MLPEEVSCGEMRTDISYVLRRDEVVALDELVQQLMLQDDLEPCASSFFDESWRHTQHVPEGLRQALANFRICEDAASMLIEGFPVSSASIGSTPENWETAARIRTGRREEFFLSLVAMCIGEAFGWRTLQSGRLIQNVLPIAGKEDGQSGHSSSANLNWHTEDGFHLCRPDYLLLLCLRNTSDVPTVLSSIRDVCIPDEVKCVLFEDRFRIVPDDEHLGQLAIECPDHPGVKVIRRMNLEPPLAPVLFGDWESPYLRIDPTFMSCDPGDDEAFTALNHLVNALSRNEQEIVLRPGSILVIDNYLAVHGRRPFRAKYDGSDRWLKKIIVTRDLRKSRAIRNSPSSRVLVDNPTV